MSVNGTAWTPSSWRSKPIKQEVVYEDKAGVIKAVNQLSRLPPIVTPHEIVRLKNSLRDVALGNAFLLQGGDCAELFDYCNQDMIEAKVKLILQMSLVLIYGAKKKVVRVARMAGQYAKPRSSPMETVDGVSMPSFKGDIVNNYEADPVARIPDPSRLLQAYQYSSATLNYLRAAIDSGLADLHAPMDWSLGHVIDPTIRQKYQVITEKITDTLDMMRTIGLDTGSGLEKVDLYTSHEGLLLDYEEPLTRSFKHPKNAISQSINLPEPALTGRVNVPFRNRKTSLPTQLPLPSPPNTGYYNTSAHFLWIGDRTRQLTHAHVEFFRGLSNPIGVKVGPTMSPSELAPLLDILNPFREIGKVVLISRYGADKIAQFLPAHIRAVQASGHTVVWQCDPMHGNGRNATVTGPDGSSSVIKTRRFQDILSELQQALQIHKQMDSYLGGMHLEMTGENITECTGGAGGLTEEDLSLNYTTFCDPRLNVSSIAPREI
jgi:3-deoxy-7-phosphoheptulonate synthase